LRLARAAAYRPARTWTRGQILNTGTVKWFNAAKGFGFIQPEGGGADAFVHISAVERAGLDTLNEGDRVEYELVRGQNGKSSAENLKLVS
jgi:cold shock protein